MASYEVVPPLEDLRVQLNQVAPDRDKTSDGSIGDQAHSERASSHNPDETGTPEWRDSDSKNEIRARDFDKDLRRKGLTMEMVVQLLVRGARSGRFWWLRYIIYAGRIWHKNTGFETRTYSGSNGHYEHAHINTDFTQAADNYTGADYGLEELLPQEEDEVTPAEFNNMMDDWFNSRLAIPAAGANPHPVLAKLRVAPWQQEVGRSGKTTHETLFGDMQVALADIKTIANEAKAQAAANRAALQTLTTQLADFADDQEVSAAAEAARDALLRAELNTEIANIPGATIALLGNPSTPDEEVADVLVTLLGDRRQSVIQLMQNR